MIIRRILVPVDFSTQSDLALEYARHIATRLDAMISCIYVIEDQRLLTNRITSDELKHRLRREAETKLSERVNSVFKKEAKVPFELIITSGNAHQKVLEKSIDLNALMIVIGRSNSSQIRTTKIGSNTKKIVSKSLVPVIVANKQGFGKRKHLILPLDLETPYRDKLTWTIEISTILGAFVSVISIIEKERSSFRPVYLSKLKEIGRTIGAQNIECDTHLLENQSTISGEILKFSDGIEYGIILLMNKHDKKSERPYLGLIENEVFTRTEVPVLFLNPRNTVRLSLYKSNPNSHLTYPTDVPMEDPFI